MSSRRKLASEFCLSLWFFTCFQSPAIFLARLNNACHRPALFIVFHRRMGQYIFSITPQKQKSSQWFLFQFLLPERWFLLDKFWGVSNLNQASPPGGFSVRVSISFRCTFSSAPRPQTLRGTSACLHYKVQGDHQDPREALTVPGLEQIQTDVRGRDHTDGAMRGWCGGQHVWTRGGGHGEEREDCVQRTPAQHDCPWKMRKDVELIVCFYDVQRI
nr:uncharacterized protein LOC116148833 [Camelus dromedarius]